MIPASYKLKLTASLSFRGHAVRGQNLTCITRSSEMTQFGVKVGKRVDKRAVIRNRLRRQILFWLYQKRQYFACRQVLVIVRQPMTPPLLFTELETLLIPSH